MMPGTWLRPEPARQKSYAAATSPTAWASSVMRIFVSYFSGAESGTTPAFGDLLFSSFDIEASLHGTTPANPTKELRAQDKNGPACQHHSRAERGFSWITGRQENQHNSLERQERNRRERVAHGEDYCFRLPRFAANYEEAHNRKAEKKNGDEKEIRDDLFEGAQCHENGCDDALNRDGARGRAETRVEAGHGFQKHAVASHRVVHAWRGHYTRCQATEHTHDDDRGKHNAPSRAEKDFSCLRDERAVGGDFFDRDEINKNGADGDIHGSDRNHANGQCARKSAARVAHFAGDFCGIPPAAEAEEGADQGTSQGRRQWQRARTLCDERNEI